MNSNRLIPAAAAAAALLVTGGVAYAVTTDTGGNQAPQSAVTASESATTDDDNPSLSDLTPDDTPSASPSPDGGMGSAEAERTALAHVGGGTVTEVEREMEHGRLEWKVEIVKDGVEHDVRVDAASGEITRVDTDDDRDDNSGHDGVDDDDDRDDDDSGHGGDDD